MVHKLNIVLVSVCSVTLDTSVVGSKHLELSVILMYDLARRPAEVLLYIMGTLLPWIWCHQASTQLPIAGLKQMLRHGARPVCWYER